MADNNTKIIISAEDKASAALASISKNVGGLQTALGGLGATLGATLTVGGFTAFIKSTIDAADQMNDLSQRIGIAVKDLGTWELAAKSSGTSMESVARGVKGLSAYMHDHAKELKAAGITATDAGGAMTQLADIFKAMPDGVEKTNLAVKLFGKAGMDLLPMMNLGSAGLADMQEKAAEYGRRLAILAPEADKFNDLLAEMSLQSKVLGINMGIELVPSLIKFAEQLMEGKKIAGGWMAAMWEFGVLLDPTKGIPESLNQTRIQLEKLHAEMAKGKAQNLADGGMTDLSEIDRNIGLGNRRMAYLNFMQRQSVMENAGKLGDYRDARDLRLANGGTMSVAEAMARADKLNSGAAGKAAKAGKPELFGPELPYYVAAALKEEAAFDARAKAFIEQHEARAEMYRIETEGEEAVREAVEKTNAAMAQEAWKASQDAAKKSAEDAAKSWENFTRDLESSLTDALMRSFESGDSFGESFVKNLKNLLKTTVLKVGIQAVVGTAGSAAQQLLGINAGGAGGGGSGGGMGSIGNLLSTGQSLYGAFTGGTAASLGGMIGGSFGAGMQGASLAAGLAGPTTAGAAGAMGAGAALASAIPYVAAAVAIASIFGGMGKKKPAPVEWGLVDTPLKMGDGRPDNPTRHGVMPGTAMESAFTYVAAPGQHLKRNGLSLDQLKSSITAPLVQLDNLLAGYLSDTEKKTVGRALIKGNEGEHGWGQQDAVMMRRLGRISDAIGGWADKAFDTTTGNLQKRYSELAQILSLRGDEMVEKLAKDMLNATGKWDYQKFANLQAARQAFDDSFLTDAERFAKITAEMQKAFGDLSLAMPDSRDAFKKMVEAVDTSTKAGFEMYVTLLDLAPTMDAYYAALKDELAIKGQLSAMNESHFSTAVDFRRYQAVSTNFDGQFAGDYAYNIQRGAIKPGTAANGDLVSEIRALRTEQQAQGVALAMAQQETARILRRWNGDGMPDVRVVA